MAPGAAVQLRPFQPPRESEPAAVVVDQQDQLAGVNPQANDDIACPGVAPDVHQRLLDDAAELAADAGRERQLVEA